MELSQSHSLQDIWLRPKQKVRSSMTSPSQQLPSLGSSATCLLVRIHGHRQLNVTQIG